MFALLFILGSFLLLISIAYVLFMCAMFLVNKFLNHDDISFWEYAKRWDW